ncbi:MAG: 6-phosphogluconolactonase [Ahrensia sp.]
MADINFHTYENRHALAEGLATGIAGILAGGIATRGHATLAVSGGSTPKLFFEVLSNADIDWSKVMIILVDERIVPPDHERSNAKLVATHLLQNKAAAAKFVPYSVDADTPEQCAQASERAFEVPGHRIDAVVLGMGTDGHTASFFPGGNRLFKALLLDTKENVIAMEAPGAGEPRLTLTLPYLLDARFVALHIEGDEKRAVYDQAMIDEETMQMPVRAVLHQKVSPISVFWAP